MALLPCFYRGRWASACEIEREFQALGIQYPNRWLARKREPSPYSQRIQLSRGRLPTTIYRSKKSKRIVNV